MGLRGASIRLVPGKTTGFCRDPIVYREHLAADDVDLTVVRHAQNCLAFLIGNARYQVPFDDPRDRLVFNLIFDGELQEDHSIEFIHRVFIDRLVCQTRGLRWLVQHAVQTAKWNCIVALQAAHSGRSTDDRILAAYAFARTHGVDFESDIPRRGDDHTCWSEIDQMIFWDPL